MKVSKTATPALPSLTDGDVKTHSVRRRAFMKAIGGTTFLLAASGAAAGCSKQSDTCRTTVDRDPFDQSRVTCDGD